MLHILKALPNFLTPFPACAFPIRLACHKKPRSVIEAQNNRGSCLFYQLKDVAHEKWLSWKTFLHMLCSSKVVKGIVHKKEAFRILPPLSLVFPRFLQLFSHRGRDWENSGNQAPHRSAIDSVRCSTDGVSSNSPTPRALKAQPVLHTWSCFLLVLKVEAGLFEICWQRMIGLWANE